ncbi:MAG: hypothetical protein HQK69_05985 [Desulfamplus sp.]|nr:hypothetical protein [Desulfamplus sp.]
MQKKYLIISIYFLLIWSASTFPIAIAQNAHSQHEVHSDATAEKSFKAELSVPDGIKQEEPFKIKIFIKDDKGETVSDFDMFQEKLMHLILVSNDLLFFSHLHPEYQGNGYFLTDATLPSAGGYTLFCDYKPSGDKEQLSVLQLGIKGEAKPSNSTDIITREKLIDDIKVSLSFSPETVKANKETNIIFDLKQALDNTSVKGLKPYLGEKGHLVIIKKSPVFTSKSYIHAHAMKGGEDSKIEFMTSFPEPGLYKMWCQFDNKGKIMVADFWITVKH